MLQYSTKGLGHLLGLVPELGIRPSQAAPVGSGSANIAGTAAATMRTRDADMFIFYNQIKSVPGFLIEPYYVLYSTTGTALQTIAAQGLGTAKHSNQTRHMIGNRIEMRKGGFDFMNEIVYQFGQMGDTAEPRCAERMGNRRICTSMPGRPETGSAIRCIDTAWKPRIAFNLDYASGDGRNNHLRRDARLPVRRPTRLKTSFRRTTSTWATWTCKPGRTC